jgi:predicted nuclease of predicted toxin-antitoxin system
MKLLVDNQLPLALAIHLRARGHDCKHVIEIAQDEATDATLWTFCTHDNRVLVSKDEDFVFLANRQGDKGRLIWVRLGNCRNPALLDAFDRVHDQLIAAIESGQRIVEVR